MTRAAADYAPTEPLGARGAVIAAVEPGSPAARAGLCAGMVVAAVDDEPLRDAIDWYWLSSEESIVLAAGESRYRLKRSQGEGWGIEFASPVFDGVRTCTNACVFCFMTMLPKDMRPSLYVRDDDYRLSFLQGNFVTLTNVEAADVRRIIEHRLSPLHVSLHAVRPAARERLMGKNQARGIEVLEELLVAGIEVHAQIVLVPNLNDGAELDATLSWIEQHSGIRSVGIVPYGYTRFAKVQGSYNNPKDARCVIEQVASRQRCSSARIQLSDEFYLNAYPDDTLLHLPSAADYDGFPQYQDGIGLLRVFADDWHAALGTQDRMGTVHSVLLSEAQDTMNRPHSVLPQPAAPPPPQPVTLITGTAFAPVIHGLLASSPFAQSTIVLAIENRFFGGNVDVAGLLTARDIIEQAGDVRGTVLLPAVMFNSDGLTLDNYTLDQLKQSLGNSLSVVSCTADELLVALESQRDEN